QSEWVVISKHIPELKSMITFAGFGKLRELTITPVIVTSIHDHATNTGTMAADPFCCRFNYDIGAMFDRAEQVAPGTKAVVNDKSDVVFLCQRGELFDIRNIQAGVADCFQVDGFCVFVDQLYKAFNVVAICKASFNAEAFESHFKLVVSATI